MNESHDSHVFCFAYSVHRLIRHALADTHAPCRIPARERSAMLSREPRSISPRLLHRFCRRFRSRAQWNETRTKTHAIRELTRGEVPKIETM